MVWFVWLRSNWFPTLIAFLTSLSVLSGIATDWLALGFGWEILNQIHDTVHSHNP